MSKRLQVIVPEADMLQIQHCARVAQLTVAEWVRRAIIAAQAVGPAIEADRKLRALRESAGLPVRSTGSTASTGSAGTAGSAMAAGGPCAFPLVLPAADMWQILAQIERGYGSSPP